MLGGIKLLTAQEVADLLRVPKARVYDLARQGLLPLVRLGRQVRFEERALREWIAGGGQALSAGWQRLDAGDQGE